MKTKSNFLKLSVLVTLLTFTIAGCKDDDNDTPQPTPTPVVNKTSYVLKTKDVLGVTGTVTFTETSSTETTIDIKLIGASATTHPAHIHAMTAVEGGAIVISLNPVDANGNSSTVVTKRDDNTPINYTQLIAFDGYLNVHESVIMLATIIAQGDIGGNALSSNSESYNLAAVNGSGVNGTALLQQRQNGNSLLTVSLSGTIAGGTHPAYIRLGSTNTVGGGPVSITLNPVDGATGKSYTTIRQLDNGTAITFAGITTYDGYLTVHESALNLTNIISQGNIGSNN